MPGPRSLTEKITFSSFLKTEIFTWECSGPYFMALSIRFESALTMRRELNFPSDFYPKIDVSKYDTEGYSWVQFHKVLQPEELNNEPLFEYLKSLGMCSYWIELFYTPPNDDGVIHCDNNKWEKSTKIYFQYGAEGSTLRWWDSDKVMEYRTDTMKDELSKLNLIFF